MAAPWLPGVSTSSGNPRSRRIRQQAHCVNRANFAKFADSHAWPGIFQIRRGGPAHPGNAFFVAAEFTLVAIRDTRVQQLVDAGVPGARAVRRLQKNLDDFLSAVQLGVTLCSLALGWVGEPFVATYFQAWFHGLPHANLYAHAAAVIVAFAIITYF